MRVPPHTWSYAWYSSFQNCSDTIHGQAPALASSPPMIFLPLLMDGFSPHVSYAGKNILLNENYCIQWCISLLCDVHVSTHCRDLVQICGQSLQACVLAYLFNAWFIKHLFPYNFHILLTVVLGFSLTIYIYTHKQLGDTQNIINFYVNFECKQSVSHIWSNKVQIIRSE